MNKLFDTTNLTHEDVQQMLSLEDGSLTTAESIALEKHLAGCEACTQFAQTIELFRQAEAVAYSKQTLTLTEKAEIVSQIDTKLGGPIRSASDSRSLNRIASSAVALMATLILGAFLFTISRPQQTTTEIVLDDSVNQPLDEVELAEPIDLVNDVQSDYDGWELGVAFDIPDEWSKSQLIVDELNGDGIVLAMGNEIHDLTEEFPPQLEAEETFGFVLVDTPNFQWAGSPVEQLEELHLARPGAGDWLQLYEIAGRYVIVSEVQMLDNTTGALIYTINGSLQINGRFVHITIFGRFANESDKAELTRLLNEIVESTTPVDYTGWQASPHSEQAFSFAHPNQLTARDTNGGTVVIEQIEPNLPFRFLMEYEHETATSRSLAERQLILLSGFGGPHIPVDEPWSPTHRPDLLLGRYNLPQAEGLTLLTGILENPDPNSTQPYIALWLLLDDSQVDRYQPQFERILRSIRWEDIRLFPSLLQEDETGERIRRAVVEEFLLPDSSIGTGLKLYWVDWNGAQFQPGDEIEFNFEWQMIKRTRGEYDLFIHLINSEGELVAQLDSEPVVNMKPTSTWPLWALVVGQHRLTIPDDIPAGDYSLVMGHYDVESGERLRINGNDSLELGLITIIDPEAVDQPSAEFSSKTSQLYDGWELGISFDIPAGFINEQQVAYQEWNGGRAIMMGQSFSNRSASSPLSLAEGEMAGLVFVADAKVNATKSADEQLMEFHTSRVGDAVSMELAGQSVLISKREVIEGNLPMYAVDISLIFDGRLVQIYGIGNFGGEDDSDPIVRNLVEIIGSMELVNYSDWLETTHPTGGVRFMRPNFTQQVRLLENTAIYADVESSSDPFLLYVDRGHMISAVSTPEAQIDRLLADFGESTLVETLAPPSGRSDLLLRRYDFEQTADVTFLVGALEDQSQLVNPSFAVVGLYISKEDADRYLPLFEQIVRSIQWQDGAASLSSTEDDDSNPDDILSRLRNVELSDIEELEVLNLDFAQLQDGVFESDPLIIDGAVSHTSVVRVLLVDSVYLIQDFDGDGVDDAIGLLKTTFGGTGGSSSYLALFVDRDGVLVNVATLPVGLKTSEEQLFVEGNQIILEMIDLGPGDSQCCPTQKVRNVYLVGEDGTGFIEASSEILDADLTVPLIESMDDIEVEFREVILGKTKTVIELTIAGPQPDLADTPVESNAFYQFGFPTTISTENGTTLNVSEILVLQEMTNGRLNRLEFDSIPEVDRSAALTLTVNYMFREFPADRMVSVDLGGRQSGEEWQINETITINGIPITVETVQLSDSGTSLQLLLAPAHDLEKHIVLSTHLTVLSGEETLATSIGSIDGDLWEGGLGKITVEAEFEERPDGVIDLFFEGDIQYLERDEFVLDVGSGAEKDK